MEFKEGLIAEIFNISAVAFLHVLVQYWHVYGILLRDRIGYARHGTWSYLKYYVERQSE